MPMTRGGAAKRVGRARDVRRQTTGGALRGKGWLGWRLEKAATRLDVWIAGVHVLGAKRCVAEAQRRTAMCVAAACAKDPVVGSRCPLSPA